MARRDDETSGRNPYSSRGQIGRTPEERARAMERGNNRYDDDDDYDYYDETSRSSRSKRNSSKRNSSNRNSRNSSRYQDSERYQDSDRYRDSDRYQESDPYQDYDIYTDFYEEEEDEQYKYESARKRRARKRREREQKKKIRITGAILGILFLLALAIAITVVVVVVSKKRKASRAAAEALASEMAAQTEIATETETEEVVAEVIHTDTQVNLVMVGDVLLHDIIEQYSQQEDGSYDYSEIFANMSTEFTVADLAMVNEETLIGGDDLGISGYPTFNASYALADDLVEAGFDVILCGNDHCLDMGEQGLLNCLNYFGTNYPDTAVLGIHDSQEDADTIYVYEKDGLKIAILNYTFDTDGNEIPQSYEVDLLDETKVRSDIEEANELADFVIVCPHWGTEFELGKTEEQEKWCDVFLDEGVDLVIGTHPHVIEPIEILTNEQTGDQMLVYYSLGNFVSWTSRTGDGVADRSVGGMAQVTIGYKEDGSVGVLDYGVQALVCQDTEATNGITVYPLSEYNDELAAENAIALQDPNFSYQYCVDLCNEVWGDDWN